MVLEGGVCPPGAHPIVILLINGDTAVLSNITDIENEDFIPCLLEPKDDPRILNIKSTFRYNQIKERSVKILEAAIDKGNLRHCGQLASAAFNKIIQGSQSPEAIIKLTYKTMLKPAAAAVATASPTLSADA